MGIRREGLRCPFTYHENDDPTPIGWIERRAPADPDVRQRLARGRGPAPKGSDLVEAWYRPPGTTDSVSLGLFDDRDRGLTVIDEFDILGGDDNPLGHAEFVLMNTLWRCGYGGRAPAPAAAPCV